MAIVNNIKAVTDALDSAMEKHKEVVVFGEDVGTEGGVFRATQGLQVKYGKDRCFNAPISEAMFAGVGLGMAMAGMKPVVELQFEGLGLAAFQNIMTNIARMRNRTRGKYTAPMVIRTPMGGGIRALEHHSEALEAIFAHTPGIQVVCPSTPYDTRGLILAAIESPDPVIVLEPTKLYRAFKQEIPDEYYTIKIGEGYKIQEGNDLTVVTYGAQTVDCQKAVELLKQIKKTGRLLVVHEAVKSFSVSSEIMATVNEECFEYLKAPLARCTGYDVITPFDRGEGYFQTNPLKVFEKMKELLDFKF
ncbi:hypothetical protein HZH68_017155 [Vespula germanica]|uniref:Transketolase-like pyrimidine-binding domain-containing protein n=1 Tax=Vespula germanica TaxID=30212 RepID=A0A834IWW4_VESGE|nr:hypothetical protein HZH68_017155 [Vespula germanica]